MAREVTFTFNPNPAYIVQWEDTDEHRDHIEIYAESDNNKNEANLRFEELINEKGVNSANIACIERTTEWYPINAMAKGVQDDPEC